MNEIYTTVVGRLVADPESRVTRGGVPFSAFRLASTVRRPNPQTRAYEDGPTNFFNVTAFRSLGANVGNSLKKGESVVVHGRLRVNQWMRADNSPATSVEIDAFSIGHDLNWGTTALTRVVRAQVDQSDRLSDAEVQAVHARLEGHPDAVDEGGDDPDGASVEGGGDETGLESVATVVGLDPDRDPYEVEEEPTGVVPRALGQLTAG